jgi:CIC family chloride channel protein
MSFYKHLCVCIKAIQQKFFEQGTDTIEKLESHARHLSLIRHTEIGLIIIAALVGLAVGLSIVVFHTVTVSFEKGFELIFEMSERFAQWSVLTIPLICALGGLGVGVLNETVFKDIPDEGLPFIVKIIESGNGLMRRRTSLKAIINASLSISSGGGAGREAPTILLGASVASTLGQLLSLRIGQMRVLCAAGSAAAISGIFNAPLGGVVFALEGITGKLNLRFFIPIVVASVMSTAVVRIFLGNAPLLVQPEVQRVTLSEFFLLAIAGVMSALVAIYYLKVFILTRNWVSERLSHLKPMFRPALGGMGAGVLVMFLPTLLETTYQPINQVISGQGVFWMALATILLKPISNGLTLGSGGAGGTLAPAMKAGAMFGFCFGYLLTELGASTSIGLYALVCAAATLAGTYAMPLSAAIILFEISRNYDLILPLLFASVFSSFVIRRVKIETFNPIQNANLAETQSVQQVNSIS